jgi:hypothetical protein
MDDSGVHLALGDVQVSEGLTNVHTHRSVEPGSFATVRIDGKSCSPYFNWQAEARLVADHGGVQTPLFTGVVDRADKEGDAIVLHILDGAKVVSESRIAGWGISGQVTTQEKVFSLLRTAGLPPERMKLEGWVPGPWEPFEVAVPLAGIEVGRPRRLANVQFLPSGPVSELAGTMGPDELNRRYRNASGWALVLVNAPTLFEAEQAGLGRIDTALAWLHTVASYSSPRRPDGELRPWSRDWAVARVNRVDAAVVRGLATQRWWLRAPITLISRPVLVLDEIADLERFGLSMNATEQDLSAVRIWQRSQGTSDPLAAAVGLNEALEFLASGESVATVLTKEERRKAAARASEGLNAAKAQRVKEQIGRVNDPSLAAKLEVAAAKDGTGLHASEWELLRRIRAARNDAVHGRGTQGPQSEDVQAALGVVGRMLAHRMQRRGAQQGRRGTRASSDPTEGTP